MSPIVTLNNSGARAKMGVPSAPPPSGNEFVPASIVPEGYTLVGDTTFSVVEPAGWAFSGQAVAQGRAVVSNVPGPYAETSLEIRQTLDNGEGDNGLFYPTPRNLDPPVKGLFAIWCMRRNAEFNHDDQEKVYYPNVTAINTNRVGSATSGQYRWIIPLQTGTSGYNNITTHANVAPYSQANPFVCNMTTWYKVAVQMEYGTRFTWPNKTLAQAIFDGDAAAWDHIAKLWISEWDGNAWGPMIQTHNYTSGFVWSWGRDNATNTGDTYQDGFRFRENNWDVYRGGGGSPIPNPPNRTFFNRCALYTKPLP